GSSRRSWRSRSSSSPPPHAACCRRRACTSTSCSSRASPSSPSALTSSASRSASRHENKATQWSLAVSMHASDVDPGHMHSQPHMHATMDRQGLLIFSLSSLHFIIFNFFVQRSKSLVLLHELFVCARSS